MSIALAQTENCRKTNIKRGKNNAEPKSVPPALFFLVLNDKIREFFSGLLCFLVVVVIIITGVFLLVGGAQAINKEVEKTVVPPHIE